MIVSRNKLKWQYRRTKPILRFCFWRRVWPTCNTCSQVERVRACTHPHRPTHAHTDIHTHTHTRTTFLKYPPWSRMWPLSAGMFLNLRWQRLHSTGLGSEGGCWGREAAVVAAAAAAAAAAAEPPFNFPAPPPPLLEFCKHGVRHMHTWKALPGYRELAYQPARTAPLFSKPRSAAGGGGKKKTFLRQQVWKEYQ